MPRCPAHGKRPTPSGSSVSISMRLGRWPCTSVPGVGVAASPSASMASDRLPSVAESPHTISSGDHVRSRASANWTCTPRLLPTSSCHSSTTTTRTELRASRASARASSNDRLSGVVTRAVGRRRDCAARSALPVSPVRKPSVQCGAKSCAASVNARVVSAASARMGVSHSTDNGGAPLRLRTCANRCSAPSQTA